MLGDHRARLLRAAVGFAPSAPERAWSTAGAGLLPGLGTGSAGALAAPHAEHSLNDR